MNQRGNQSTPVPYPVMKLPMHAYVPHSFSVIFNILCFITVFLPRYRMSCLQVGTTKLNSGYLFTGASSVSLRSEVNGRLTSEL